MARIIFVIIFSLFACSHSLGACSIKDETPISFSFPNYEFYKFVGKFAEECINVTGSYAGDASAIGLPKADGSRRKTLLGVSTNNIQKLYDSGLLRPLNGLVTRHGKHLSERQLIRRGNDIVAIALTANTQYLVYHNGIFTQENISAPQSTAQLLGIMKKLSANPVIKRPYAVAYKKGWNVANEFINLMLADGNALLDRNNRALFNNVRGETVLKYMASVLGYISTEFDQLGPNRVKNAISQGEVAMASVWASNVSEIENPQLSRVAGRVKMVPLPGANIGGKPSSTLWWDGVSISSASTDLEADKAFLTLIEATDKEMLEEANDSAIWLMKDYVANRISAPVIEAMEKGIPEFPASPAMDQLIKVLGDEIPRYLKGDKNVSQTLIDVEVSYMAAARERGLVN